MDQGKIGEPRQLNFHFSTADSDDLGVHWSGLRRAKAFDPNFVAKSFVRGGFNSHTHGPISCEEGGQPQCQPKTFATEESSFSLLLGLRIQQLPCNALTLKMATDPKMQYVSYSCAMLRERARMRC